MWFSNTEQGKKAQRFGGVTTKQETMQKEKHLQKIKRPKKHILTQTQSKQSNQMGKKTKQK